MEWLGWRPDCSLVNILFILTKSNVSLSTKSHPSSPCHVFTKTVTLLESYLPNLNFMAGTIISEIWQHLEMPIQRINQLKDSSLNQFCIIGHEALSHCCLKDSRCAEAMLTAVYALPHSPSVCWRLLILSLVAFSCCQMFKKRIFHKDFITYFPTVLHSSPAWVITHTLLSVSAFVYIQFILLFIARVRIYDAANHSHSKLRLRWVGWDGG